MGSAGRAAVMLAVAGIAIGVWGAAPAAAFLEA